MPTQKAGTVLLNLKNKKICLIYDKRNDSYTFPKGHLESGETLAECAVRETEEETLRANHLLTDKEIKILKYTTPSGENVECHMYIAIDDGPTAKAISDIDKEIYRWFNFDEIEKFLVYDSLRKFWLEIKNSIDLILNK